ncbi:MAG TPA: hypothetical protein PKD67_11945 [Ignavibacteriaceae bacterium]|nr:hypothetical protein [Ignavibacteriaceae bacterium]HMN49845.1 hypothetical protein [Ignavibacteriaceae bacterium]
MMIHSDVLKIVSNNVDKFEEVYIDFQNLEATCEMLVAAEPDSIHQYINMLKNTLIKFKTSKFQLIASSIGQEDPNF